MKKLIERIRRMSETPPCERCGKPHTDVFDRDFIICALREEARLAEERQQRIDNDPTRIPKRLMALAILLTVTACGRSVTAPPQCVAWTSRTDSVPLYRVADSSVVGYMTAQNPVCFRWEVTPPADDVHP